MLVKILFSKADHDIMKIGWLPNLYLFFCAWTFCNQYKLSYQCQTTTEILIKQYTFPCFLLLGIKCPWACGLQFPYYHDVFGQEYNGAAFRPQKMFWMYTIRIVPINGTKLFNSVPSIFHIQFCLNYWPQTVYVKIWNLMLDIISVLLIGKFAGPNIINKKLIEVSKIGV
jgi:hypothetical protein